MSMQTPPGGVPKLPVPKSPQWKVAIGTGLILGLAFAGMRVRYDWLVLMDGYPLARVDNWTGEVAFCNARSGCLSHEERMRRARNSR